MGDLIADARQDSSELEHLNAEIGRQVNEVHEEQALIALATQHEKSLDAYRQRSELRTRRLESLLKEFGAEPIICLSRGAAQNFESELKTAQLQTQRIKDRASRICERARDKAESPDGGGNKTSGSSSPQAR